jgi:hypothetical protein
VSAKRKTKKKKEIQLPKLNAELQGFDIFLDEFGRVKTNQNLDHINSFLNRNVIDRKLEEKVLKEAQQAKEKKTTTGKNKKK